MVRGPKPKPTKLKILAGEKNKDRINQHEPEAPAGRPPLPASLDDVGRRAWHALCDALESLGILSTVDALALQIYSECYSGYRHADDEVKKTGMVLTIDGKPRRNPYMAEVHQHRAELIRMHSEFGITPASRSRLVVPGAEKAFDILDELTK